jgi:hypothetical protein
MDVTQQVAQAQDAFWATIAALNPQVSTGDFDPAATQAFDEACQQAVTTWLESNDHKPH